MHPLAVAGHGDVARVDARAHLGHDLQVPQVVLGDPAVARGEEDVAPVGRELRSAVQRVARREAGDRLERSPSRIDAWWSPASTTTNRFIGSAANAGLSGSVPSAWWTTRDAWISRRAPDRLGRGRRVDERDQRVDLLRRQLVAEGRHLRRQPALRDHRPRPPACAAARGSRAAAPGPCRRGGRAPWQRRSASRNSAPPSARPARPPRPRTR